MPLDTQRMFSYGSNYEDFEVTVWSQQAMVIQPSVFDEYSLSFFDYNNYFLSLCNTFHCHCKTLNIIKENVTQLEHGLPNEKVVKKDK